MPRNKYGELNPILHMRVSTRAKDRWDRLRALFRTAHPDATCNDLILWLTDLPFRKLLRRAKKLYGADFQRMYETELRELKMDARRSTRDVRFKGRTKDRREFTKERFDAKIGNGPRPVNEEIPNGG